MMESDYSRCCDSCFDEIAKVDSSAANIWMQLCCIQSDNVDFIELYYDFPELRTLEKTGYVLSTERGSSICVKLLGWRDNQEPYFCIKEDHV